MNRTIKAITMAVLAIGTLTACQENLDERSAREAREYTAKYCPTPVVNSTRIDSVVFYKSSRTYTYYCSFVGRFDSRKMVEQNRKNLHDLLLQELKDNTGIKKLKEAGYSFAYIIRSGRNPRVELYRQVIAPKDYR